MVSLVRTLWLSIKCWGALCSGAPIVTIWYMYTYVYMSWKLEIQHYFFDAMWYWWKHIRTVHILIYSFIDWLCSLFLLGFQVAITVPASGCSPKGIGSEPCRLLVQKVITDYGAFWWNPMCFFLVKTRVFYYLWGKIMMYCIFVIYIYTILQYLVWIYMVQSNDDCNIMRYTGMWRFPKMGAKIMQKWSFAYHLLQKHPNHWKDDNNPWVLREPQVAGFHDDNPVVFARSIGCWFFLNCFQVSTIVFTIKHMAVTVSLVIVHFIQSRWLDTKLGQVSSSIKCIKCLFHGQSQMNTDWVVFCSFVSSSMPFLIYISRINE